MIQKYNDVIVQIRKSIQIQDFWIKYSEELNYASSIEFDEICNLLSVIMDMLL